ncbi:MAG: aminoacyl-tRNA hydrolase [Alphaproteobacteria bacterium]|nr:aminoacyl-tRNA hydrolase [Alphaproteobacteria bacterium]
MLLLIGLGNPGPKYEKNRHNIGFMAVDEIVHRHGFGAYRARFQSLVAEGKLAGEKVLVIKPTTFMNESGRAVGEAMRFYKLAPSDVLVIHDELDLVPGKIRLRKGGGLAGHNGLRSINAHIGPDFQRMRVGIGHPGEKSRVHGHVLSDFSKAETPLIETLIDAISESADLLAPDGPSDGHSQFMTKVALRLAPPKPKSPKSTSTES